MKNTRENVIKLLNKQIENKRYLKERSPSDKLKQCYHSEITELQHVIYLLEDKDYFNRIWETYSR